ncbi:methyltransferase domain-containing protein, partial [Candidatus Uhrbacteria bacterium]|nr:methyltransferase domain-containing protein [Candidatus Uhrbacteria bacterium]
GFPRSARDDAAASVSDFRFQISDFTILDPFCGSGTILTEVMALGIPRIIGTDVDVKAVADAKENVEWLRRQGKLADVRVERCDVRKLSTCVAPRSVDAIVTEPYLGPPGGLGPSPSRSPSQRAGEKVRAQVIRDLHALYLDAFREFAKVLKPGGRVVFIVPEFQRDHSPIRTNRRMERGSERRGDTAKDRVDITRDVERLGFRRVNPFPSALRAHATLGGREDLPYARPDQHVGRRILVFVRT